MDMLKACYGGGSKDDKSAVETETLPGHVSVNNPKAVRGFMQGLMGRK